MKLFYYILSLFSLSLQSRHKLVKKNIGFFHYTFNKKFSNVFTMNKEDLRQECYYGFVKAANNYNSTHNVSFLVYSKYYIHGYGLNALRKYNKTKLDTVDFEGDLLKHTKTLYKNDILDIGHDNVDAIRNFVEYCNKSKYGNLLEEYYYNNLSFRKISKKYNIPRSTISNILKREISLFRIIYGYSYNK